MNVFFFYYILTYFHKCNTLILCCEINGKMCSQYENMNQQWFSFSLEKEKIQIPYEITLIPIVTTPPTTSLIISVSPVIISVMTIPVVSQVVDSHKNSKKNNSVGFYIIFTLGPIVIIVVILFLLFYTGKNHWTWPCVQSNSQINSPFPETDIVRNQFITSPFYPDNPVQHFVTGPIAEIDTLVPEIDQNINQIFFQTDPEYYY